MGAEVEEFEDGLDVPGGQTLHGATIDSGGDHRIAMAFSVAALRAEGETLIQGAESAAISFPGVLRPAGPCRGTVRLRAIPLFQKKKARHVPGRGSFLVCIYVAIRWRQWCCVQRGGVMSWAPWLVGPAPIREPWGAVFTRRPWPHRSG
jgi:hypothetical protein